MQTTRFSLGEMLVAKTVEKRKMRIGDWCVFQCEPDSSNKNKRKKHRVMVGHVMSFRTLSAASKKEMNATILEWDGEENVGALCHWYDFEHDKQSLSGLLKQVEVSIHGFHPCHFYVCSVPPPQLTYDIEKSIVKLSDATVFNLNQYTSQYVF